MIKEVFKKNKVFFTAFLSFLLYHHLFILDNVTQTVNGVAYEFHAVDYSLGFCTKILPGAIYHLLVGRYTELAMTVYTRVISILLIFFLSLLVQRVYAVLPGSRKITGQKKNCRILFLILCLANPCTFDYVLQFEACLDAYWVILFLICVLSMGNRILRWGIPLVSFLMVLVHEGAILCYLPLLSLLLLLKFSVSEEKKEKSALFTVLALTVVVSLGTASYFMLYNGSNLKISDMEQLGAFLNSRNAPSRIYYEWYFFGNSIDGGVQNDFFPSHLFSSSTSPLTQLFFKILRQIYYTVSSTDYIFPMPQILYALPIYAATIVFLLRFIRQSKQSLSRFIGVCFLLLPMLSITAGIMLSNDVLRWFSHALICLLCEVVAVSCLSAPKYFMEIESLFRKNYSIILPYIIGYPILLV